MSEEFVSRFAEAWNDPSPERLNALVHPQVHLVQPMEREVHGRDEATRFWTRLFEMIPDLRGDVLGWAARGDQVFVELRLEGTVGGRPLAWTTNDRITLEDGLVKERIAYFDTGALAAAILRRPSGWLPYLRARLRRR